MDTRGQDPENGRDMRMLRTAVLKMGPGRDPEEPWELRSDAEKSASTSLHCEHPWDTLESFPHAGSIPWCLAVKTS